MPTVRVRSLSWLCLAVVAVALLALTAHGAHGWRQLQDAHARIDGLEDVQGRLHSLAAAVDYTTLLRTDPRIISGIIADAQSLRERTLSLDEAGAERAAYHLAEIAYMGRELLELHDAGLLDGAVSETARNLHASQVRIHYTGVQDALAALVLSAHASARTTQQQVLYSMGVAAAMFALLVVVTTVVMLRRIGRPLHDLVATIRAVGEGDAAARVPVCSDDEIAEVARTFNAMVDQRQARDEALVASEARFRQIAESVGEVFWISDPGDLGQQYVSPAFESIWGLPVSVLDDDPLRWNKAIHEDDRPRVMNALRDHALGFYRAEYRIRRPDGSIRWIDDRSFPVRDADGRIVSIVGVARDVTDRKAYQAELGERIKELRCLYQVLELISDRDQATDQLLTQIVELLPPALRVSERAVARIRVHDTERFSGRWAEPESRLRSPIVVDRTEVGEVEIGYLQLPEPGSGESAFLVEEHTLCDGIALHLGHMLEGRRLSEIVSRSERLQAVGELTGGIAHDFNNLLTVMLGNAELLQEQLESDEQRALAQTIVRTATRGAELTQRLLAFARRQPLEPKAVEINALLQSMDDMLDRTLGDHISVDLALADDLWDAQVDAAQLENALLNLALNARDAMPQGGRLGLETGNRYLDADYADAREDLESGDYVMLAVSDTGTGISPEVLGRVFEPFFSTKEAGRGTGLGLSMVYGFVKQSRGHIEVYSEVGYGTTVRMYLPRASGSTVRAEPKVEVQAPAPSGATILLVEDDALVRNYASQRLDDLGYKVITAVDGASALEVLRSRDDIDLLFTDVVMPGGMSGRDLAAAALKVHPQLRVLYTSGYAESVIVHRDMLTGDVKLLRKPYRGTELAEFVRDALASA